jgi:N-acetylneuraminic acid mutarotase
LKLQLPTRRGAHATAVVNGVLWLFGGDNGHGTYFNDMYRMDLCEMTSEKIRSKGTKPSKRGWHSMVSCRSKLYVFGGTDGSTTHNDLHVFDTISLTWSCPHTTGEPAEPLFSHSAVMIGHEMLVFGVCLVSIALVDFNQFSYSFSYHRVRMGSQSPKTTLLFLTLIVCVGYIHVSQAMCQVRDMDTHV